MSDRRIRSGLGLAVVMLARVATAQTSSRPCDYSRCALNIIPRLTALDVVRGDSEERVGSLAFLFPRDVSEAFAGSAEARAHADRAFGQRRVGAVLTNVGGALLAGGLIRTAATSDTRRASIGTAIAGAALVGISVPIHFAADAELSRAVREFNRRFAR
jgi:hypothetical protein